MLRGSQLTALLGTPVNTLGLVAWREGRLDPIPFQIDPAYPGPAANCGSPHDSTAPLRATDELAAMLADFDGAAPAAMLPAGSVELTVSDPLGGPTRYAYLVREKNPPRRATSYVQFDPAAERVESDYYRLGLKHGWPDDFADQDYRFEQRANQLDHLSLSMSSRILGLFHYAMTEHDLRIGSPIATCGPVRITLRYNYAVSLLAGIRSPSIAVPIYFYRQFVTSPMTLHFPWLPRLFFSDTQVKIAVGYIGSDRARVLWQGNDAGVPLDDRSPASLHGEMTDPGPVVDWIGLRQDGHLLIQGFPASPDLALLTHRLAYRDGPPDGDQSGKNIATLGYDITRLERLSAGKHVFDLCFAVLDGNVDPDRFMVELRAPVQASAAPVAQ